MEYIIGFIVSALVGFASVFIFKKHNLNGELKITETNEKDFYTLYVDNLENILRRKYLLLKINKPTRK
jgi:hypothetical protein